MVFTILGAVFVWTYPIWAFVFVHCLVKAITRGVREGADGQGRKSASYILWAALSFSVILGGITSLLWII